MLPMGLPLLYGRDRVCWAGQRGVCPVGSVEGNGCAHSCDRSGARLLSRPDSPALADTGADFCWRGGISCRGRSVSRTSEIGIQKSKSESANQKASLVNTDLSLRPATGV